MTPQVVNLPKQLKTALRKQPGLSGADDATLLAFLSNKSLAEIADIKGIGTKLVSYYALDNNRAEDLFEQLEDGGWVIEGIDRRTIEINYYHSRLKEQFVTETFNDEQNLKHLAQLYAIRRELTSDVRGAESMETDRSRMVRELSTIEGSITTLEKHLEIDPSTRGERTAKEETSDLMSELVDTATDYLVDEGVVHTTNHGAAGITLWYFKAKEYMPRCAVCKGQEFVFRSPWDEQEFPFVVATPQQMENYVAAASFIPEGAPNIELFSETWPLSNDKSSTETS